MNVTANGLYDWPRLYTMLKLPVSVGGGYLAGVAMLWNGLPLNPNPNGPQCPRQSSILAFKSQNGLEWKFSSVLLNASDVPFSLFGPSEHDMTVLADGKTVMAAIRIDGDGPCSSDTYGSYYQSYSSDGGTVWTAARPIAGTGCVRPRLMRMEPVGPLLMSGGRLCTENTTGLFMWVNYDGMAGALGGDARQQWVRHSLSYWHNKLWRGNIRCCNVCLVSGQALNGVHQK